MILRVLRPKLIMVAFAFGIVLPVHPSFAVTQNTTLPPLVTVEWYPPEMEATKNSNRAQVVISGRTLPRARIKVDGENFTMVRAASAQTEEVTPAEAATPVTSEVTSWKLSKRCKVYTLPHANSKVAGELKLGAKYRATDYSDIWLKVTGGKKVAYAQKNCFTLIKTGGSAPAKATTNASGASKATANAATTAASSLSNEKMASPQTVANADGFFEVTVESPQGLVQIPVQITAREGVQKTFLVTFEVAVNKVKMNTEVSKNKPPAAAKSLRLWLGLGTTLQKYSQTVTTSSVAFQNTDSPSVLARLGYWKNSWGFDLFYRDAPGKIEGSTAPFNLSATQYHWQTTEARGHYQFERGAASRMLGLPSQWQFLFGLQMHKIPFLAVDGIGNVSVLQNGINTAIVGVGLLLGQERDFSYEFALEYQQPISSSTSAGNFSVSGAMAYDARLGLNYKLSSDWRLGVFAYLQSHTYKFNYDNPVTSAKISGTQDLFYSTFDFHIGYEY